EHVNPEYLAARGEVNAGDAIDTAKISEEAQRIAALRDFETVGYRLDGERDSPDLVWLPQEKRWGPDYLTFDLGMYASEGGGVTFAIYGRHHRRCAHDRGLGASRGGH